MNKTNSILIEQFNISPKILEFVDATEKKIINNFKQLDDIAATNQYKILKAFQDNNVSDIHFNWKTGYGYDDQGRDIVEKVYSSVFHTESSLVRPLIVNGTHALSLALLGTLRPGDEMISCTGTPYDTLEEVIGINGKSDKGSLKDYGVEYRQIELLESGKIDTENVLQAVTDKTKMFYIQRAMGYGWRKAITIDDIREFIQIAKSKYPNIIVMVDNCYGEFIEDVEPTDVGADIMAGSLIKNPGGGLALSGGYITGKKSLIEKVAYRMTCPGIGDECGLTFGQTRTILQGLFLAPKTVNAALKGAMLCGQLFKDLGYEICPDINDHRSDIIQGIKLEDSESLIAFCQGIQNAAPIDSFVKPVPSPMPGYKDEVIMAAGAFVQGSSIELSADGPLRPPYNVYFQGGLTYEHSKIGTIMAADTMFKQNLLKINRG